MTVGADAGRVPRSPHRGRRLQVRRRSGGGDETIFAFDYRAYEKGYDLEGNVALRPGDVIIVPDQKHNEPFYEPNWSYWEHVVAWLVPAVPSTP